MSLSNLTTQTVGNTTDAVGNTVGNTTRAVGGTLKDIQISPASNASASGGSTLSLQNGN